MYIYIYIHMHSYMYISYSRICIYACRYNACRNTRALSG